MVSFTGFVYAFIILILGFLTLLDRHFWPRENGKRVPFKQFVKHIENLGDPPKTSGGGGLSPIGITVAVVFVGLCFIFSQ